MTAIVYRLTGRRLAGIMNDRVVIIVAMVCGTAVAGGVLILLRDLITSGHGSETLLGLGAALLLAYMNAIRARVADVPHKVAQAITPAPDVTDHKSRGGAGDP